jgi:TP901 family phage tail tape measure protein
MNNQIKQQIKSMAVSFGKATSDIADAYYNILSASFEVSEAMKVMRAAAIGSVAGMTDLATSTKVITAILNAYGMEADNALNVSDKLFAMVKRGVFTYQDLAKYIGNVLPVASQMGVSLEQVGAALTTSTRQAVSLRKSTTALSRFMTAFAQPTRKAADIAEKYGFQLNTATLRAYGLTGIMEKLKNATAEELVVLSGSKRAFRFVAAAANDTEGQFRDLKEIIDSSGDSMEAFNKMSKTTQFRLDKMNEAVKGFGESMGQAATKLLYDALKKLGIDVDEFTNYGEQMAQNAIDGVKNKLKSDSLINIFNRPIDELESYIKGKEIDMSFFGKSKTIKEEYDWLNNILKKIKEVDYIKTVDFFKGDLEMPADKQKVTEFKLALEKMDYKGATESTDDLRKAIKWLDKELSIMLAKSNTLSDVSEIAKGLFKEYKDAMSEIAAINKKDITDNEKFVQQEEIIAALAKSFEDAGIKSGELYNSIKKMHQEVADGIDVNIDFKKRLENTQNVLDNLRNKFEVLTDGLDENSQKYKELKDNYLKGAREAIQKLIDTTEKGTAAFWLANKMLVDINNEFENTGDAADDAGEELKGYALWLKNLKDSSLEVASNFKKLHNELYNIDWKGSAEQIERFYQTLKKLYGEPVAESMLRSLNVSRDALLLLTEEWKDATMTWADVAQTAYESISSGFSRITDDIFDGVNMQKKKFGEYFKYIANQFAKMLTRMVIELAAKKVLLFFLGKMFPTTMETGNIFGTVQGYSDMQFGGVGNTTPNVGGAANLGAGGGFNDSNIVNRLYSLERTVNKLSLSPNINVSPNLSFSRRDLAFISKEGSNLDNATRL